MSFMEKQYTVFTSLTVATILVFSPKRREYENLWSRRSYHTHFFKFYYLITKIPTIQIRGSLCLGQQCSWLSSCFLVLSIPLGIQDTILLFLAAALPLGKQLGHKAHVMFKIMVWGPLGGQLEPRQYKNKCDTKSFSITNAS